MLHKDNSPELRRAASQRYAIVPDDRSGSCPLKRSRSNAKVRAPLLRGEKKRRKKREETESREMRRYVGDEIRTAVNGG